MKIGEAGEAFFVFEADGDVPDDLVTSPLLEATQPGQSNADAQRVGRFGAQEETKGADGLDKSAASQEPDFLDLNASPQDDTSKSDAVTQQSVASEPSLPIAESSPNISSSLLDRTAQLGKAVLDAAVETEKSQKDRLEDETLKHAFLETGKDAQVFIQDTASAVQNSISQAPVAKGDEALPDSDVDKGRPPDVQYTESKS